MTLVLHNASSHLKPTQGTTRSTQQVSNRNSLDCDIFEEYPPELLYSLPVKQTITEAQAHPDLFGSILPPLVALVANQLPHLLEPSSLLEEIELKKKYTYRLSLTK